MASPQTEDGFVMVALDLFPAIMSAGLSGYAQIVLAEVLLQWGGPKKRRKFYLVGSELHELTGLDRNNARRAIHELVEANIIKPSGNAFTFNKDFESWRPKTGPLDGRLGGRLMEWIKGSVERFGTPGRHRKKSKTGESTQTHPRPCGESTQTQETASERVYLDSPTTVEVSLPRLSQTVVSESTQTHPHIEERARQKTEETREERLETQDAARVSRPPASTDPEYAEVGQHAIEITADYSWGRWVSDRGRDGHPARLIRQAIDDADGRGKLDKPYVLGILQRCAKQGITDLHESRNGPQATTPREPIRQAARGIPSSEDAMSLSEKLKAGKEGKDRGHHRMAQ